MTGPVEPRAAWHPGERPVLSILTVAGGSGDLARTHRSLRDQSVDGWEWVVVGGAQPGGLGRAPIEPDPRVVLLEREAGDRDNPVAGPLSRALEVARGEHVLVLAPGDRLPDDTVSLVRQHLPAGAWGYSDEVQIFGPERSPDLWLKPDHAPELLRSQPYPVRSAFLPRDVLLAAGGFRPAARSAAVYDAVLRLSETADGLRIPHPLVHRTDRDLRRRLVDGETADHVRAVREHCERVGIGIDGVDPVVTQGRVVGLRVRRSLERRPSVSIVIPTRGSASVVEGRLRVHVAELVRSLWVEGRYPDLEVVVVYDMETPEDVLRQLREVAGSDLVLVPYDDWFHFSRKCNHGAMAARGEYLLFLNDDTEVRTPDWLHEMVARLSDPQVGGVGARLVFADGSLQHIGHSYSGGDAGHPLFGWRSSTLELAGAAQVAGERVGVTAACLLVRASDFFAVGGFSEAFPLNYNDVDLCLKLRELGFRLVYTPHAELYHFESQTRVARVLESEVRQVRTRWSTRMKSDAYLRLSRGHRVRARFVQPPTAAAPVPEGPGPVAAPGPDVPDVDAELATVSTGGEI